jgi:hypothetical protein
MKARTALLAALLLAACAPAGPSPDEETATAEVVAATEEARSARATGVAGTQAAVDSANATQQAQTQVAESKAATSQASTQVAITMATQAAAPMAEVVDKLAAEGTIASSQGSYKLLDPFDASWAQLNWYQWTPTGESPTDYVVRANATWDSASDKADWWNSGCGLVFRLANPDNHYAVSLGLDGYANMWRFRNGIFAELGRSFHGPVDVPRGSAELMLVVEGNQFTFYVDGERALQRQDSAHPEGELAYTLNSGTNKDWGTRCQLNNVGLWTLE